MKTTILILTSLAALAVYRVASSLSLVVLP